MVSLTPQRRAFLVALAVAALVLVVARAVAPAVLGGPPAPLTAWAAWLGAVAPFAGAVGTATALEREALGRGWNERSLVVIAGWIVGGVGSLVLLAPIADASVLFPVAMLSDHWEPVGSALVDPVHAVRVDPDGRLSFDATALAAAPVRALPGALAALVGVASLALWAPLAVAIPGRAGPKVAGVTLAIVISIVLFHAVAAGRADAALLAAGSLPLVCVAAALAWRERR